VLFRVLLQLLIGTQYLSTPLCPVSFSFLRCPFVGGSSSFRSNADFVSSASLAPIIVIRARISGYLCWFIPDNSSLFGLLFPLFCSDSVFDFLFGLGLIVLVPRYAVIISFLFSFNL